MKESRQICQLKQSGRDKVWGRWGCSKRCSTECEYKYTGRSNTTVKLGKRAFKDKLSLAHRWKPTRLFSWTVKTPSVLVLFSLVTLSHI